MMLASNLRHTIRWGWLASQAASCLTSRGLGSEGMFMLKWIAAAFALLPVAGFAADTAASCKVGVQLYSFRNDLDKDLSGTLARIKKLGVNCVEPYSLHKLTAEQLRAEFDRAGLKVVSFHLPGEL